MKARSHPKKLTAAASGCAPARAGPSALRPRGGADSRLPSFLPSSFLGAGSPPAGLRPHRPRSAAYVTRGPAAPRGPAPPQRTPSIPESSRGSSSEREQRGPVRLVLRGHGELYSRALVQALPSPGSALQLCRPSACGAPACWFWRIWTDEAQCLPRYRCDFCRPSVPTRGSASALLGPGRPSSLLRDQRCTQPRSDPRGSRSWVRAPPPWLCRKDSGKNAEPRHCVGW